MAKTVHSTIQLIIMQNDFSFLRRKILEQSSISKFIVKTGISRGALYNLLNGKVGETKLSTLITIAEHLDMHPIRLLSAYFKDWDFSVDTAEGRTRTLEIDDDIGFVGDITIPDNSIITINQTFIKTWRIQNTGRITWKGRKIICVDDTLKTTNKSGKTVSHGLTAPFQILALPDIQPNEKHDISIQFTAPTFPCTVVSHWKMIDSEGEFCFPDNAPLSCIVKVISL